MTTVNETAGGAASIEQAPAAVIGPLAGDPSILGLGSFIAGSVALGLGLVGVVPAGVLGAPLAIILAATALGLLLAAVWAAAVGQSAVAARMIARGAPSTPAGTTPTRDRPSAAEPAMKLPRPRMDGSPARGPTTAASWIEDGPPAVSSTVVIGLHP